jgi:PAS domain S-box-containing protein
MMDRSPMAIYIVDDETGDVLYFNETFAGMWGIERPDGEASDRPNREEDLLAAMSRPMVVPAGLSKAWEPGAAEIETIRLCDGRVIICQRPQIVKIDGHVYRRQMFEDITTQSQTVQLAVANEALRREIAMRLALYDEVREKEIMLARAQETAHLGNLCVEADGRRLTMSEECARVFGFERQAVPESIDGFLKAVHQEDTARVGELMENVMAGGQRRSLDFRAVMPDGTVKYLHSEAEMIPAGKGSSPQFFCTVQDVSERHRMEESLVNSEALYRAVVDDQTELICRFRPGGDITFVNEAFRKTFGPHDGKTDFSFTGSLSDASRAMFEQSLKGLTERAPVCTVECGLTLPPGKDRWLQWTIRALYDRTGRFSEYQCVGRDITDKKAAEDRSRHISRMENLAIEISKQFVQLDRKDIDREINHALRRVGEFADVERSYLFLFSRDQAVMDKTHEWCARGIPDTRAHLAGLPTSRFPWWMDRLKRFSVINTPRVSEMPPEAGAEKELLTALDVRSAVVLPLKYQGKLIGLVGFSAVRKERCWPESDIMLMRIVGDIITSALMRKAAELELMESDLLFQMLTESIHTVILVYAQGRFIYSNRAAASFTGYSTGELSGMSFWDVVHQDMREEVRRRGLARQQGSQEPSEYRLKFLCKDGSVRWAYVYVSTSRLKDEMAIIISGIDLTDLQAAFR